MCGDIQKEAEMYDFNFAFLQLGRNYACFGVL